MTDVTLVDVNGSIRKVRLGKELASGGAGAVHSVQGDSSIVVKLYNAETLRTEGGVYADKINRMLQYVPSVSSSASGIVQLAWPLAIAREGSGRFVGFSMPALDFKNTEGLESLLIPKQAKLKNLRSDLGARITVAANLAGIVRAIHDKGHQIVDMKPPNLRFYTKELYVAVLDCDGFQVQLPGKALSAPQVTIDYLAPEYQSKPIVNHEYQDRFALAVIIFRLLNFGTHPYTGIAKDPNAPTDMEGKISRGMYAYAMTPHRMISPVPASAHNCFPDDLRRMFDRAFGSFVDKRPTSGEWADFLKNYAQKSNALLERCSAGHLWFSGRTCGECQRDSVLIGISPTVPRSSPPVIVPPVSPTILPPVTQPTGPIPGSSSGNPIIGTSWIPRNWSTRIALGAFLLFCIGTVSHLVSYYALALISIGLGWGLVKLNSKTVGSTFADGAVIAVIAFVLASGGKFGWHKVFGGDDSHGHSPIVVATPAAESINAQKMPPAQTKPSEAQIESERRARVLAKQKTDRETIFNNTKFSSKEILTFGPIDARFYASLRKQWNGVANSNDFRGDVLYRIANGYADRYLMTYANLDDDPIPEVIIKNQNCSSDGCEIIVVKQISSGMTKGEYAYISGHTFIGEVGVTNEKTCGFRSIYDVKKQVSDVIKAEPIRWLDSTKIDCKSHTPSPTRSDWSDARQSDVPVRGNSNTPPVSVDLVRAALSVYPFTEVSPHLRDMLDAIKNGNDEGVTREADAIKQVARPARGDRKIARAANTLGLAAMEKNSYGEAVNIFAKAVKADPGDQEIIDNLAGALLKSSRLQEAGGAATAALSLNPMRSSAWANLAAILAEEGKEGIAVAAFQLAYSFSRNREKTREYLERVMQEDASSKVRDAASKARAKIREPLADLNERNAVAERPNTPKEDNYFFRRSGERCSAHYDCGGGLSCIDGVCGDHRFSVPYSVR